MLVLSARTGSSPYRVRPRRRRGAWRLCILLLAAGVPNGGCGRSAPGGPHVDLAWTLSPAAAVAGPATLTITLRGPSGAPLKGAAVRLEAHMSHAGMAPVMADAVERARGVYEVPFTFTMQGDWVLLVSAALPDGGRIERRIDVANVRRSG